MCSAGGGVLVEKTQWWRSRRSGGAVAEEMYAAASCEGRGVRNRGVIPHKINSVFLEKEIRFEKRGAPTAPCYIMVTLFSLFR